MIDSTPFEPVITPIPIFDSHEGVGTDKWLNLLDAGSDFGESVVPRFVFIFFALLIDLGESKSQRTRMWNRWIGSDGGLDQLFRGLTFVAEAHLLLTINMLYLYLLHSPARP